MIGPLMSVSYLGSCIDVMLKCHWILKREPPDVLPKAGIPFYEILSAGHTHIQVLIVDDVLLLPFCLQKRLELNVGVCPMPRQRLQVHMNLT